MSRTYSLKSPLARVAWDQSPGAGSALDAPTREGFFPSIGWPASQVKVVVSRAWEWLLHTLLIGLDKHKGRD